MAQRSLLAFLACVRYNVDVGIYSTAYLVFGLPVEAYEKDEDGFQDCERPTRYVDDGGDAELFESYVDWKYNFSNQLGLETYGHYEDSYRRAILAIKGVKKFRADCWDAKRVDFEEAGVSSDRIARANAEAKRLGWDDLDFNEAAWYLVCSVG